MMIGLEQIGTARALAVCRDHDPRVAIAQQAFATEPVLQCPSQLVAGKFRQDEPPRQAGRRAQGLGKQGFHDSWGDVRIRSGMGWMVAAVLMGENECQGW